MLAKTERKVSITRWKVVTEMIPLEEAVDFIIEARIHGNEIDAYYCVNSMLHRCLTIPLPQEMNDTSRVTEGQLLEYVKKNIPEGFNHFNLT